MLTRHALSRRLDADAIATLDWWIGPRWEQWDLEPILEEFCEPDDDGKLAFCETWLELTPNEQYELFCEHERGYITLRMNGLTIYQGSDEDEAVDAFNALAEELRWAPDGEILAVDPDDMQEQCRRFDLPIQIRKNIESALGR